MVREMAVYFYLRLFSLLFSLFNLLPLQKKVVLVASFTENNLHIYDEMQKQNVDFRTIILANEKVYPYLASETNEETVLLFEIKRLTHFIMSIYHLATAKVIFVDNYYGFLAATKFKKDAKCIQIWHANGAIKKFGLKDQSIEFRTEKAKERFKKVYNNFHKVIVGSEAMADIFTQAFGLPEDRILRTGVPRTDLFYNAEKKDSIERYIYKKYPFLSDKKVILYAPTFRDEKLETFELHINLKLLQKELEQEYILLLKLHPAIKNSIRITEDLQGFVYDFSDYPNVNELFFVSDILITDYSSLPFEYAILNKPMVFFPYDLAQYSKTRGFWEDYKKLVPGPIAYSTTEIIHSIKTKDFQLEKVAAFNQKWNTYSKGHSSGNIVAYTLGYLGSRNVQARSTD
ncbi:CDP-glycerol glycerophosphotransferase family protein [Mesobacillus maritimus]|uniref:CDP-glycerol glycerophosphotransferase family protein n=1 Tax=Mesobacillus maritimus TaxID=1643336 RepID=UPI00203DFE1B|nr:CDP-glycerol glycerophosphotransferase family protein [Mesobacillus maritimus]